MIKRVLFFVILIPNIFWAQDSADEWIIQISAGIEVESVLPVEVFRSGTDVIQLSETFNIYKVRFDSEPNQYILNSIYAHQLVKYFYRDSYFSLRNNTPNDPIYPDQWDMDIIGMPEMWDLSQGGLTARNDEIVIGILDNGFYRNHTEFTDRIYTNTGEIKGDLIDNDMNGYVDDYQGINAVEFNGNVAVDSFTTHGTSVLGLIGAQGNNNLGIAGINWNIKMLTISVTNRNGGITESAVITGMGYLYDLRKSYNDSNGQNGAFIAGVNLSFGQDFEKAEDHPAFCNMFDELGSVGILSAVAASNRFLDADDLGDLPSVCPSDYLISVTNSDRSDNKVYNAGFGQISVDLAAPGNESNTTSINDGYRIFNNNSASTPHVTGAIGMLYSIPCSEFIDYVKREPASGALIVKSVILEGTDHLIDLEGITTSEGRLNVFSSAQIILEQYCFDTEPVSKIKALKISPNPAKDQIKLGYETDDLSEIVVRVFDILGKEIYTGTAKPIGLNNQSVLIQISNTYEGIHFLTISKGKEISTLKFLVME